MEGVNKGVYMIQPLQYSAVSFQGNDKTEDKKRNPIPDISSKIDEFNKETEEVTHSVAKASKSVTGLIGQVSTTALGIWAVIKSPFMKITNFFTETVKPAVKNEAGEVVEQAVKKINVKRLGIAGAVVAAVAGALAIIKAVNKKSEKAEFQDTVEISKKEEPTKEIEKEKPAEIDEVEEDFEEEIKE